MSELLAKIGSKTANTNFSIWWVFDEVECPKSLIK